MANTHRWLVRIAYREPVFERKIRRTGGAYRWGWEVHAPTADEARRLAIEEFERVTRLSSVGWAREIVAVECRPYVL